MAVPTQSKILIVGGGPAGSFSAQCLAREGHSVTLLEADKFPRYHVGESMLPSMRHYLQFTDCYEKFDAHGFRIKNGGAFKLNWSHPETYTDFIAAGGPGNYSWNVVRSEADDILFRHAGECGAKIFDETKVTGIEFAPADTKISGTDIPSPGKPVAATWTRKDGTSGTINFDYLIDASGRNGMISTKYLKNRRFNQGLKNIAVWGYWNKGGVYGVGTHKVGSPYFEALKDASGWVWFIPLHNGTHSVGVVMNQEKATAMKKATGYSGKEFYLEALKLTPGIEKLLSEGSMVSDVKSASDWSYSASSYAFPNVRIAGDAGCFIDPFFSSGVHLALSAGLSAAATISAALRGDVTEEQAADWHSKKVRESYTRFLVVVVSSLKQIRAQDEPILSEWDEESFERAFRHFRPIIQGTADADVRKELTGKEINDTLDFCFRAYAHVDPAQKDALLEKLKNLNIDPLTGKSTKTGEAIKELEQDLAPEELQLLDTLRARRLGRAEDSQNIESFKGDAIDGLVPRLERGSLGLQKAESERKIDVFGTDLLSKLKGETKEKHQTVGANSWIPQEPVEKSEQNAAVAA